MNNKAILSNTESFVKHTLADAEGGHDWWHTYRVWKLASTIAKEEAVDHFIVELGALLHDIADSKFHDGNEDVGPQIAADFLSSQGVSKEICNHIVNIIANISFKGGRHKQEFTSPELEVIQDADRLDAIGAIGIARCFNYGGYKNRKLYDPGCPPNLEMTVEEYKKSDAPSINHFYEKLLLLQERMNTPTGKRLALHRHRVMEQYLDEFFQEWNGEL